MFAGQGAQHVNMGVDLYKNEMVFKEQVDICSEYLKSIMGIDLRHLLYPEEADMEKSSEMLKNTAFTQPALFTIEYALAKTLLSWGIKPSAFIGHSIGEYVAACISGVFELKDALLLVAHRGRLMQDLPGGAMLAVNLEEAAVESYLDSDVSIAAINAPALTVVSGTYKAIEALKDKLNNMGIGCTKLHTSHAFHSFMMDPVLEEFKGLFSKIKTGKMNIPFISNVTGNWIKQEEAISPEYWAKHLRKEVRFSAGIQELLKDENRILLEVGPGQTLNTLVRMHEPKDSGKPVFSTMRRPQNSENDYVAILGALGRLWLSGTEIDWDAFHAGYVRKRVLLPTYPFDKQSYWVYPENNMQYSTGNTKMEEGKLDLSQWFYLPQWKNSLIKKPEIDSQATCHGIFRRIWRWRANCQHVKAKKYRCYYCKTW